MVAKCFSKYDCLNFDGHKTEATIHDGLRDELVEDPKREDGFITNDNECSNEERE